MTTPKEIIMEVDDCWVERWGPEVAAMQRTTEDECFAAFRVTFTLTRDEAIRLLGKGHLPRLSGTGTPAVVTDDMPKSGERWKLVRVVPLLQSISPLDKNPASVILKGRRRAIQWKA